MNLHQPQEISNTSDTLDIRDIIARIEWLEMENTDEDAQAELTTLTDFMAQMAGYGGDEQWRGVWYPDTLIHHKHFKDYAQELAEEIGAINRNATWPNNCIDWDKAAEELETDYTSFDFDGEEYLAR